jgi:hypothetical protein
MYVPWMLVVAAFFYLILRCTTDGAVMMVLENLLAFVDKLKMIGQLETPREGLMKIAASFPSVMKPR